MKRKNEGLPKELSFSSEIQNIFESEISKPEKLLLDKLLNNRELIKKELQDTYLKESLCLPVILQLMSLHDFLETYKANCIDKKKLEFLNAYTDLYNQVCETMHDNLKKGRERLVLMADLIMNHPIVRKNEARNFNIDIALINSTFYDYHFLTETKRWLNKTDNKITTEFMLGLDDLKTTIFNLINFNYEELDNLNAKPKKSKKTVVLTSDEIKTRQKHLEMFDELSQSVFSGTLNKTHLDLFYKHLTSAENKMEFNFLFRRLSNVFNGENRFSERAKKLLLHEIFVIYKHPSSITDDDEERYLSKNENATNDTSDKRKVRVIQSLIPNLK